jgi:hypothetical protein
MAGKRLKMTQHTALIIDDNAGNLDVLVELLKLKVLNSIVVRRPERLEAVLVSYDHLM